MKRRRTEAERRLAELFEQTRGLSPKPGGIRGLGGEDVSAQSDLRTIRAGFQSQMRDRGPYAEALSRVESRLAHLEEGLRRMLPRPDWPWWEQYEEVAAANPKVADDILTLVDGLRQHEREARSLLSDEGAAEKQHDYSESGSENQMARCDKPGCLSRVTEPYLVGLGGMVAHYCAAHAAVETGQ